MTILPINYFILHSITQAPIEICHGRNKAKKKLYRFDNLWIQRTNCVEIFRFMKFRMSQAHYGMFINQYNHCINFPIKTALCLYKDSYVRIRNIALQNIISTTLTNSIFPHPISTE